MWYNEISMDRPIITKDCVRTLSKTKFLNTFDLEYKEGSHYYIATRRDVDNLTAVKSLEDVDSMLPDAVTCLIIIKLPGEDEKLLLQYEYRFPIGQYVLCPPAGILDPADIESPEPLITAAKREIKEETGITVKDSDKLFIINDLVFSTPGFTDECNGLVVAEINLPDLSCLNHDSAEVTELFGDFVLLSKEEARELVKTGYDPNGHHYPLYAYCAMTYFLLRD